MIALLTDNGQQVLYIPGRTVHAWSGPSTGRPPHGPADCAATRCSPQTLSPYLDSPEEALTCVAGYTISNDVSEREFQLEYSGQWDLGKSCDTFNPLGPWLVTPDEVGDPQKLLLTTRVNGAPRQHGTTGDMIFGVAHLLWYLSQYLVLEPGDVVNTGTPAGVALGLPDQPYLRPGDTVVLGVDGLGSQRQTFAAA